MTTRGIARVWLSSTKPLWNNVARAGHPSSGSALLHLWTNGADHRRWHCRRRKIPGHRLSRRSEPTNLAVTGQCVTESSRRPLSERSYPYSARNPTHGRCHRPAATALTELGPASDQFTLTLFPSRAAAIALNLLGSITLILAATGVQGLLTLIVSKQRRVCASGGDWSSAVRPRAVGGEAAGALPRGGRGCRSTPVAGGWESSESRRVQRVVNGTLALARGGNGHAPGGDPRRARPGCEGATYVSAETLRAD